MADFFTSDLHFHHGNIIRHCNRPWPTVDLMNEALIQNWNADIKPGDTTYVAGDLFFGPIRSKDQIEDILSRLNGKIVLIKGNHDVAWLKRFYKEPPMPVYHYKMISVEKQYIFLCHYPMVVWDRSHYGTWHLYGHSHEDMIPYKPKNSLNIGIDLHGYKPLSFKKVKEIMAQRYPVSTEEVPEVEQNL